MNEKNSLKKSSCLELFGWSAVAALFISIIVLSLVPPISRDALVHHLAVPKLYLQHGGIYEIPSMEFSYYPMNLDLLYVIPLYFGVDIAAKFIHFSFGLLTAIIIYLYLKNRINKSYALLGVFFFLSTPIIIKLSTSVYVDLGLVFFTTLSLLAILEWQGNQFKPKYLVISAISCGLALGTKYNGLIIFFILTCFVPFIFSIKNRGKIVKLIDIIKPCFAFFSIAILVFSPWMIRNYCWTKNPIYPLYNNIFQDNSKCSTQVQSQTKEKGKGSGIFTSRSKYYNESGWEMVLLPIRIFFQGEDRNMRLFDGKLNPLLLLFPVFAFFPIKRQNRTVLTEKKILLWFSVLFFFFAFFSTVLRIRYIVPIVPLLVLLSIYGIKNLMDSIGRVSITKYKNFLIAVLAIVVVSFLSLNIFYVKDLFAYIKPFDYISGNVSRDDYIARFRFEHPVTLYINKNLSDDSLSWLIYLGKRGYYLNKPYAPDRANSFINIVKNSNNSDEITAKLIQNGVTHLVIQTGFLNKWQNEIFSAQKQALFRNFFKKNTVLLYHKNDVGVFELLR